MSSNRENSDRHLEKFLGETSLEVLAKRLEPKFHEAPPRLPGATRTDPATLGKRWELLKRADQSKEVLADSETLAQHSVFARNSENFKIVNKTGRTILAGTEKAGQGRWGTLIFADKR